MWATGESNPKGCCDILTCHPLNQRRRGRTGLYTPSRDNLCHIARNCAPAYPPGPDKGYVLHK